MDSGQKNFFEKMKANCHLSENIKIETIVAQNCFTPQDDCGQTIHRTVCPGTSDPFYIVSYYI